MCSLSARLPCCLLVVLFGFQLLSISTRVLTPNGDGRNDVITFVLDNPADVAVTGKVYTTRGALVASMTPGTLPNTLVWDGRAFGALVPTGVYVYTVRAESRVHTGTLVVIR